MPQTPYTYEEWYAWALKRFDMDPRRARLAARAAVEGQSVGAAPAAAERAALSAAGDVSIVAAPEGKLRVEAPAAPKESNERRISGWFRLLGFYQVAMGLYLGALVVLFVDKPLCFNIDAPCSGPSDYQVFLPASFGQPDLVLIAVNIIAGALLIARRRWVLVPLLVLQFVDLVALIPEPNREALIFTLFLILPAGWVTTFVVVAAQVGRGAFRRD
jgi:hypothetical protein